MVLEMFRTLLLLRGFPCERLQEILMVRDTCVDPRVGKILTITDAPPFSLSPNFEGNEWSGMSMS